MFSFAHRGSFDNLETFLKRMLKGDIFATLDAYAAEGVQALSANTPKETGRTAASWSSQVRYSNGNYIIEWHNSNVNKGVNISIILQYGHGTGTGGYVHGIDYINPALRPTFDRIAEKVWRAVQAA